MYLFVCVITALFTFTFAADSNVCTTPNGKIGKCISLESCTVIKRAIASKNPGAIQHAQESICGSTAHRTTPAPEGGTTETEILYPQPYPEHVNYPFLPDSTLCGIQVIEDRKATANVAEIDEFPWVAVLKYVKHNDKYETFNCTGTLISTRYVVTAASCLDLPGLKLHRIRLGAWKLSSFEECAISGGENKCTIPQDSEIAKQIPHPNYNKHTGDNNIALIRLKLPINYSEFTRSICLPPFAHPPPDAGTQVEASAWGFYRNDQTSDFKLKLQRYITSTASCALLYPNHRNINRNSVCFTAKGNSSNCALDNGSPLMRTYTKSDALDEEQFYLEGVAYNGYSRETTGQPCLYTRASRYTEWIANNIEP